MNFLTDTKEEAASWYKSITGREPKGEELKMAYANLLSIKIETLKKRYKVEIINKIIQDTAKELAEQEWQDKQK